MALVFASWNPNHVQTKLVRQRALNVTGVVIYLHDGREKISLHKIRDKAGFVRSADHCDSRSDSFETEVHCNDRS